MRLTIENESLSDLVEISLRLDGIPVMAEDSGEAALIIGDVPGFNSLAEEVGVPVPSGFGAFAGGRRS